jgi:hypothetical protein
MHIGPSSLSQVVGVGSGVESAGYLFPSSNLSLSLVVEVWVRVEVGGAGGGVGGLASIKEENKRKKLQKGKQKTESDVECHVRADMQGTGNSPPAGPFY